MESMTNKSPSQGNYDPGWNDPPTFSYTGQTSANKPKTLLNKRVAFPLNANSPGSSTPQVLPPVIPGFVPSVINLPPPPAAPLQVLRDDFSDANVPNLEDVKNILDAIIDDSPELGNQLEDIKKKIGIMENMWTEGKLNNNVKVRMLKLCQALKNAQISEADEIHKSLMVDQVTIVSSWMIGIKKLIFHCSAKNELLKIDQES